MRFYTLTPFCDYGGKWIARASYPKRQYYVVELTDMDEACGSDNDGHPRYVAELSYVNLDEVTAATLKSAKESCGWEDMPDDDRALVEVLHSYGAKAPLGSDSSDNWRESVIRMKREAYQLAGDDEAFRVRMHETPVNKLGSTAAEYAAGDMMSPMLRGIEKGDKGAEIMLKMYGGTQADIDEIKGK